MILDYFIKKTPFLTKIVPSRNCFDKRSLQNKKNYNFSSVAHDVYGRTTRLEL